MTHKGKSPPAATGGAPENVQDWRLNGPEHRPTRPALQPKSCALTAALPSRAALARRWPSLRVNRYTGRWADGATGARGDDLQSLLVFLNEGGRAR